MDLVNEKDEVIGTVWKSEAHKDPTKIHREVAIAVFNEKGEVLLQQRSMKKLTGRGEWKITAAGHVGRGEDPQKAVVREAEEELGLKIVPKYFGKKFVIRGDKEARFFWIYYSIVKNHPSLKLDEDEVMDARWVKLDKLEEFAIKNDYDLLGNSHKIIVELKKKLKL